MLEKTITEIPADPKLNSQRYCSRKLRVAAYCRVSTEEEEQHSSFDVQVKYYTEKIQNHPGWQLAGVFADEGISGVRTKNRTEFNRMIELCKKHKIDLILTKSISRFARNTLDCIKYVRALKNLSIPVIFEKENIDTSNMNSEMILTCLSSFAQAESESISGNVTKGIRMGFRQGKFSFRYANCLGYRKGPDGKPEIVPEEAAAIRMMAESYLGGESLMTIKHRLESMGVLTGSGKKEWSTVAILRILQNEKYAGDIILQKTYTSNFLEAKTKKNNGELPKYYIKDNHPAIIPREMFYQIQEEISRRRGKKPADANKSKTNRGRFSSKYALSERLVCGNCGGYFRRITWSIHGRKEIVWRCITRVECGPKACPSPTIKEEVLHRAILSAMRSLTEGHADDIADTLKEAVTISESQELQEDISARLQTLNRELDRLLSIAGDSEVVYIRIKEISDEIMQLKREQSATGNTTDTQTQDILGLIRSEQLNLTEYSDSLTFRTIEQITVLSKTQLKIRFIGGLELVQYME